MHLKELLLAVVIFTLLTALVVAYGEYRARKKLIREIKKRRTAAHLSDKP